MGNSDLKRLQQVVFVAIAAFLALGCMAIQRTFSEHGKKGPTLDAKGPQEKQTRSLHDFTKVQAGGIYEVEVRLGSNPSVTLEAPKDLLPHLTADIHNGTLNLDCNVNFDLHDRSKIRALVVTKRLTGATISGAGKMVIDGKIQEREFDATATGASSLKMAAAVDTLKLEASGAAKATIDSLDAKRFQLQATGAAICKVNGTADSSKIEVNGAGKLEGKFTANNAEVQATGASHATLRVLNSLTAEASGASLVSYTGNPKVTQHTSGVGHVSHSN